MHKVNGRRYSIKYDADTFWGEWHDIALVYTGTNMQLYVDGKLVKLHREE